MPETNGAPVPGVPVLEVAGLRKEFGPLVAVDDVSFTVPAAGSLAIVGESGSGKTTIAKMIVGLERPTQGTIAACGHDRSRPARSSRDRRRRVALLRTTRQQARARRTRRSRWRKWS